MLDIAWNTEIWHVVVALPLAIAGGAGAFLVRRRPSRLSHVLLAFAVVSAVVGSTSFALVRTAGMSMIDVREILIAAKFTAVFGLGTCQRV